MLYPRTRFVELVLCVPSLVVAFNHVLVPRNLLPSTKRSMSAATNNYEQPLRILLNGGDNMLGRAVQLTFPYQTPGDEGITDSIKSSHYLQMAMHHSKFDLQAIREQNQQGKYLWGDYPKIEPPPDLRILNLETAVTRAIDESDAPLWKLQYHFHSDNLGPALQGYQNTDQGSSPVVVTFANNHCFDMGKRAFCRETIPTFESLESNNLKFVGAGLEIQSAMKPAKFTLDNGRNMVVFAVASTDSGTPESWGATRSRPGVFWIPQLDSSASVTTAFHSIRNAIAKHSAPNDIKMLSIHWGPNWAYRHFSDTNGQLHRRELAHRLIDEGGVDLIYGHSSHHIRGLEIYKQKCIMYGTGDLINDYEGFSNPGEEVYNTFGGIFLADLEPDSGNLVDLHVVPTFMNELQLRRWTPKSKVWNPNKRVMEPKPRGAEELCQFINKMTNRDDGSADTELKLTVSRESDIAPGGPILRWDRGQ